MRFVQAVEEMKKFFFSVLRFLQTTEEKNFYCSTVCTNRRRENLNYLRFLQTVMSITFTVSTNRRVLLYTYALTVCTNRKLLRMLK